MQRVNRTNIGGVICDYVLAPRSKKVIIMAPGFPGYPMQSKLQHFLASQGYSSFLVIYRGSFESAGEFLKEPPHKDLEIVMSGIPKGFHDAWEGTVHAIKSPTFYIFGSSFGGSPALLLSGRKDVKKVVAFAPVADWRVDSEEESMDFTYDIIKFGYTDGYRFSDKNWNKLAAGKIGNPASNQSKIDGKKILIFHGKREKVIPMQTSIDFAKATGAILVPINTDEHLGLRYAMNKKIWDKIKFHLGK